MADEALLDRVRDYASRRTRTLVLPPDYDFRAISDDTLCAVVASGRTAAEVLKLLLIARPYHDDTAGYVHEDLRKAGARAAEAALTALDEARLLRLLRARAVFLYMWLPNAQRYLYERLLEVAPPALCTAVGEACIESHAAAYGDEDTHNIHSSFGSLDSEVRAMHALGVDFGAPWPGLTGPLSLGAWLRARVPPRAFDWVLRRTLDAVTPPLSHDGARAVMEATHPRLGADAPLGQLPVEVLRGVLEALLLRGAR